MALIQCKTCGGDLILTPGSTIAVCEYCGVSQTVPNQDDDKKLVLFGRANRLRRNCEFDKAAGIYESIVADFRFEAEAYWGLVLCKYGIEYVDDPASGQKIPTCHRSSYDSLLEDEDYKQTLENADVVARELYIREAETIEELRKRLLEVSSREEPYDIFICYKETAEEGGRTQDSVLAQDIYDRLVDKGYRVFFSRVTLEDKLGVDYEPYIFAALNSAKVMLAVGTTYEHYHAVWVQNEWSRFLQLMMRDKDKYLIPCYQELDPEDLPKPFRKLQGQDFSKVGAMQDLLRGVEKLLPRKQETVTVQPQGDAQLLASLKRGAMALEDSEWVKASKFYEDALNRDAECAEAYLGKALAAGKFKNLGELVASLQYVDKNDYGKRYVSKERDHIENLASSHAIRHYLTEKEIEDLYQFDRSYHSLEDSALARQQKVKADWESNKMLTKAEKFARGDLARQLENAKAEVFSAVDAWVREAERKDSEARQQKQTQYSAFVAETDKKLEELFNKRSAKRDEEYARWEKETKESQDPGKLAEAREFFKKLDDYKDSSRLAQLCDKRILDIQAAKAKKEKQQEKRRRAKRRVGSIIKFLVTVAVLAGLVFGVIHLFKEVIPGASYKKALAAEKKGELFTAIQHYRKHPKYKDAAKRAEELWDELAQRKTIAGGGAVNVPLTAAILADGTAVSNGPDVSGWTDLEDISVGLEHIVGLKSDGTVVAVGTNDNGRCDVDGWKEIVAIDAGENFTVGITADGKLVYAGANFGTVEQVVAVAAGPDFIVCLKADGTVETPMDVRFGFISEWTDIVSVAAGNGFAVGLKKDGTVVATGENAMGQCNVEGWTDIVAIDAGHDHTVGLKSDGTVVAVGENHTFAQCNVSGWTDVVTLVAGRNCTIGICADGRILVVGDPGNGQLDVQNWTGLKGQPEAEPIPEE